MSRDDQKLDELLTGGYLAGADYDRIFGRVLAANTTTARPRRRRWALWLLLPTLAVASSLLLVGSDPFTAKGPGPSQGLLNGSALGIGCAPQACAVGGTLMFSVNTAVLSGHLGAYAERLDDPSAGRIWYFPSATGVSPHVAPGTGTIVVPDGIKLGPEHRPGRYRVTLWLTERAFARNEVLRLPPDQLVGKSTLELQIDHH